MKRNILIFCIITLFSAQSFSQTIQETKDFIKREVETNSAKGTDFSYAYFKEDLSKEEAEQLIQTTLPPNVYNNMFLIKRKRYYPAAFEGIEVDIIDIKDMITISIDEYAPNNLWIRIYINKHSINVGYTYYESSKKGYHRSDDPAISIGIDNRGSALRIKKAIIHLGKLYGVTVTDEDNLFR